MRTFFYKKFKEALDGIDKDFADTKKDMDELNPPGVVEDLAKKVTIRAMVRLEKKYLQLRKGFYDAEELGDDAWFDYMEKWVLRLASFFQSYDEEQKKAMQEILNEETYLFPTKEA